MIKLINFSLKHNAHASLHGTDEAVETVNLVGFFKPNKLWFVQDTCYN